MAVGKHQYVKPNKERKKAKKRRHIFRNLLLTLMLLAGLYSIAVFSDIPFVARLRTLYIETAMGTMTHQWLATYFIPKSVIDEVMEQRFAIEQEQNELESGEWSVEHHTEDIIETWDELEGEFDDFYPDIDADTLRAYLREHGDCLDADGYLVIDEADPGDGDTGIRTVQGDRVLALDTRNGIIIALLKDGDYVARLAIIKDPTHVGIDLAPQYGSVGAVIQDICEHHGAVLGTNASGFYDPEGHGNGAEAYGFMISGGKKYCASVGSNYKMVGFDHSDRLLIGRYSDTSVFRDAVEFKPILVLDGEKKISGSAGWGIQPRTAIGQRKNGDVLLVVADGRAPGYSIGAKVGELADIMLEYDAYQAINLDGGSSSVMYYNGRVISKPSAGDKVNGRRLPNAFLVMPQK